MKLLQKYTKGNIGTEIKLFKNIRAVRAILPILNDKTGEYGKTLKSLTNVAGLTSKAFKDQQGESYKLGVATNALKLGMVSLGNSINTTLTPIIGNLAGLIEKLTGWFNKLPGPVKQLIVVLGLVTVAVTILAGAIAIITFVSAPWLLIIGAIILAITGVILIAMNWNKIMISLSKSTLKMLVVIKNTWLTFKDFWTVLWAEIKNIFVGAWNGIVSFYQTSINFIIKGLNFITSFMNKIPGINIPIIPKIDLTAFKGQITDIRKLKVNLQKQRNINNNIMEKNANAIINRMSKRLEGTSSSVYKKPTTTNIINIDNVNGLDPDMVAESLNNLLRTKINI